MTKSVFFKYKDYLVDLRRKAEGIMDNKYYWLWLSLAFDSNACAMSDKVLYEFGSSAENVFNATEEMLKEAFPDNERLVRRLANKNLNHVRRIITECEQKNIGILTPGSLYYPRRLTTIAAKPMVLYYKGCIPELNTSLCISVVGTRKVSQYGTSSAYTISYDAAKSGAVIISGMAEGIDGIAHRGALDAMGKTVAVLGSGIDIIYPKSNTALYNELLLNGLIISEYPPGTSPNGWRFPQRNRIISGLSSATLVVEAPERSGSLITADYAKKQGRLLYAVPGKVGELASLGTNQLIRDGAKITTCASDILNDFYSLYPSLLTPEKVPVQASPKYSRVARTIHPTPLALRENPPQEYDRSADYMSIEVDQRLENARRIITDHNSEPAPAATFTLTYPDEPLTSEGYKVHTSSFSPRRGATLQPNNKTEEASTSSQSKPLPTRKRHVKVNKEETPPPQVKKPVITEDQLEKLTASERQVVEYLLGHPKATMDEMTSTGLPIHEIMGTMTLLEIHGIAQALPGGYYKLIEN